MWIFIVNSFKFINCTKDILNKKIKNNYIINSVKVLALGTFVCAAIAIGSYKPVFKVYVDNKEIGYISDKVDFEERIKQEILTPKEENAVAIDLKIEPTYEFELTRFQETNEDEIVTLLSKNTVTTYMVYAININNEPQTFINNWDEAESIATQMQEEYSDVTGVEITVTEKYTENIDEIKIDELAEATSLVEDSLRAIKDEQIRIAEATLNGVYFGVKPVSGYISSRFGAVESVRNHTHKGIDIAAPGGTPIRAAADGIVVESGWHGGYGNLIIIDHGNNVKTYYGHCSKIYVSAGQSVTAGDTIGAVGTTGNSTGNHLHFEIRLNGEQINPQKFMYK